MQEKTTRLETIRSIHVVLNDFFENYAIRGVQNHNIVVYVMQNLEAIISDMGTEEGELNKTKAVDLQNE